MASINPVTKKILFIGLQTRILGFGAPVKPVLL
jgi:hypothetical protein